MLPGGINQVREFPWLFGCGRALRRRERGARPFRGGGCFSRRFRRRVADLLEFPRRASRRSRFHQECGVQRDRKSVVWGKRWLVRVDMGGGRRIKKQKPIKRKKK